MSSRNEVLEPTPGRPLLPVIMQFTLGTYGYYYMAWKMKTVKTSIIYQTLPDEGRAGAHVLGEYTDTCVMASSLMQAVPARAPSTMAHIPPAHDPAVSPMFLADPMRRRDSAGWAR
ncbi:hypothetical protein LZ31DRAFT_539639 [Colletotrichum somersetense]|nr:hypothetical protein LZ31DRAFT_539639 [Colletotrichum somersetense]